VVVLVASCSDDAASPDADVGPGPDHAVTDGIQPSETTTTPDGSPGDAALSDAGPTPDLPPGSWIVVPDDHATIGAAVAAASAGQTIVVKAGTYPEQVDVDKSVDIIAFGNGPVWVDAACTRTHCIRVTASQVKLKGLGCQNSIDAGVLIENGAGNVTLEGMTIEDFDCKNQGPEYRAGVGAWYAGSKITLLNNTVTRRVKLTGGLAGGKSNCVWFKSTNSSPSGGGHLIKGNKLSGCYDCIGGETESDIHGCFDKDTVIENNTISDCYDDGIQVEGGTQNVVVRNNTIKRAAIGIASAGAQTGPLTIEKNTITEGKPGYYDFSTCFKIGKTGAGTTYFTDNTCILSGSNCLAPGGMGCGGWSQTNSGLNTIVTKGNKISTSYYVIELSGPPAAGTSFDNDCLHTTDTTRFVKWNGQQYDDLAAFQSATGQENNGTQSSSCSTP